MNKELISELALKSYIVVGDYSYCESVLSPEKFARLILKECISLLEIGPHQVLIDQPYDRGYFDSRKDVLYILKQHFGIENE